MASDFNRAVYDAVKRIPSGRVTNYGFIALMAGRPRAARAVGLALHHNPEPGITPCHRVLFRDGTLSPAFAFGGENVQRRLLEDEGIEFLPDGRVDMARFGWYGDEETEEMP